MENRKHSKNNLQLIWGLALVLAGIAVFFRIPQVMPKLVEMGQSTTTVWFIRICFYLVGGVLVGGGLKKIVHYVGPKELSDQERPEHPDDNETSR